jgi:hypothetical protein
MLLQYTLYYIYVYLWRMQAILSLALAQWQCLRSFLVCASETAWACKAQPLMLPLNPRHAPSVPQTSP